MVFIILKLPIYSLRTGLVIKSKNKALGVSKLLKKIQSRKKFYKIQEPKTLTLNLENMFKKSTL